MSSSLPLCPCVCRQTRNIGRINTNNQQHMRGTTLDAIASNGPIRLIKKDEKVIFFFFLSSPDPPSRFRFTRSHIHLTAENERQVSLFSCSHGSCLALTHNVSFMVSWCKCWQSAWVKINIKHGNVERDPFPHHIDGLKYFHLIFHTTKSNRQSTLARLNNSGEIEQTRIVCPLSDVGHRERKKNQIDRREKGAIRCG